MNIASIKVADCANGPGMRTSVFVSGCNRHCKGCFNEVAWDFSYGEPYTREVGQYITSTLVPDEVEGLSILGGEPLDPENLQGTLALVARAVELKKSAWLYTGYTYEELIGEPDGFSFIDKVNLDIILDMIDVLVDGPFIESEKDISLRFRGSRNQRIIDMGKTMHAGRVILWEEK